MSRISSFSVSALPCITAAALLCSAALLGPNAAQAQTATNLNCNKCVDTGDIAKKAITKNRIKKGTIDRKRLNSDLQEHFNGRESYYVTLDGSGSTATIAVHGPLRYFARCLLNQPIGGGRFEDRLEIVATSSVAGWFEEDESDDDNGGNTPLTAGQEVIVDTDIADPPGSTGFDTLSETSVVAPDGSYLALDGDSGGNGQNIFGHDCLVTGNIFRNTGTP